ncbi:MAG TPA: cobalamin-binding protein [Rhodocyclaceae bacterium]|nr:cobalamin-binding protein [Rhodocyclaceae bacterium]
MQMRLFGMIAHALLWMLSTVVHAQISVTDEAGQTVRLAAPARRIVSLAPHLTENLYVAGAGEWIVGAVDFSDYPTAAQKLPRVGSYPLLDLEAIAALKPDLIVAWEDGKFSSSIARLKILGIPLYISQPKTIEDIAVNIERLGTLAGTAAIAGKAAQDIRARQSALRARYADRPAVRVFYQIWDQPLTTINGGHLISDAMRLCGAENVFAGLPQLASTVDIEAVLVADPEAIVASGMDAGRPKWLDTWRRWQSLRAVVQDNLFFIPPDLMQRHTARIIEGTEQLCAQMEKVRARRQ